MSPALRRAAPALLLAAALAAAPRAQTPATDRPASFRGTADVGGVLQSYTLDERQTVRQLTVPLSVGVRHASGVGVSARGVYVSATGDDLLALSGLADVQLGASYRRRVGGAAIEASVGANVPAGGGTLTLDEFATATALAFDDYAFDVPSLGQGFAVSPALSVVVPLGAAGAFGVGVAYYARSPYTPFEGDPTEYAPADEVVVSGGLDARIGRASTVALDVSYVGFGEDEFGGRTFQPGQRLAGTLRWALGGGTVRGRVLARYRHIFDGSVPAAGAGAARPVVDLRPSHAMLAAGLQVGSRQASVELSAGARYYGIIQTADGVQEILDVLGEQQVLIDVGLSPRVQLVPGAALRGTFVYTRGVAEAAGAPSLTGFRAGVGLEATF